MGDLTNVKKELEKEREKLGHMMNEARKSRQPNDEAILEQSRKVDALLDKVQKARLSQRGKTNKSLDNRESR